MLANEYCSLGMWKKNQRGFDKGRWWCALLWSLGGAIKLSFLLQFVYSCSSAHQIKLIEMLLIANWCGIIQLGCLSENITEMVNCLADTIPEIECHTQYSIHYIQPYMSIMQAKLKRKPALCLSPYIVSIVSNKSMSHTTKISNQ